MPDIAARLSNLRAKMAEANVDLVAVGPGAHMQWLLGFATHADERPCFFLVSATAECFLMPALNAEGARENTDAKFFSWADADGPDSALGQALAHVGATSARKVALDETMRADFALLLLEQLPDAKHEFTVGTLGALRMRKDDDEIAQLKANAAMNDRAMQAAFAAIRPGMREVELADVVRDAHAAEGGVSEFRIVGSGPNGAFPHHHTGERKIQPGDAIVIDIGGRRNGFPSDMTRMAVVGSAPDGYDEVHAIVDQAVEAALAAARPGVRAMDVDKAARDVITAAGYGEYFVHRTGHGLGIETHEPPYITSTSQTVLDTGMVFSIEPGIYLPGRFGIRLEEIVILREDGPEIMSSLTRDAVVVEA